MGFFSKAAGAGEPINAVGELKKLSAIRREAQRKFRAKSDYFRPTETGAQSSFYDPYFYLQGAYGNLRTADRLYNRDVDPLTLRQVAKKAWIINVCIKHIQDRVKPFLKPSTDRNIRGFAVKKTGEDLRRTGGKKTRDKIAVEEFLLNTGSERDSDRDNFMRFCLKIVRDSLEIDQCATEIAYTRAGRAYAFFAVDGATIEKVLPGQENPFKIKYIQVIDAVPQAYFPEGSLIVDYQNPRTDVRHSFYGYSPVEQAIDLVTSNINTFAYNSSYFTENKLPRGMLLLGGDASTEKVKVMREYIFSAMGGTPASQWGVPIVASGTSSNGEPNSLKWLPLSGTSREMEFQQWMDFLTSGVVALFGCSMDELGLQSAKSQPMFARNAAPEIEDSKSLILGNTLGFLQQYVNQILDVCCPGYEIEFTGYERDDPKAMLDIAKGEIDAYKTLNEVRAEKGLPRIEEDWADKCPANPQFTQMYQAAKADAQDAGDGVDGGEEGADDGDGSEEEDLSPDAQAAWTKLGIGGGKSDDKEGADGGGAVDGGEMEKSAARMPFVMVIK